jgi:hypothetical protein
MEFGVRADQGARQDCGVPLDSRRISAAHL